MLRDKPKTYFTSDLKENSFRWDETAGRAERAMMLSELQKERKSSRGTEWKERPDQTVGVDLGDRFSRYWTEQRWRSHRRAGMRTNEEEFRQHWEGDPRQRMAIEAGTQSPWVSRLLKKFGHQVIVANARKVRAIWENESKNDRRDAELLAQLGIPNPLFDR